MALIVTTPAIARAQDAFEIQVYDSETAAPGSVGVEAHLNVVADGARTGTPPEIASHHVTHVTLEPHVGLAPWAEVGAYFQSAFRADGHYDYAGVKLRLKLRLPRKLWRGRIGLAINFELSSVPRAYEANGLGSEIRPAIDLRVGRFYAAVNPIIGLDLAGANAGVPQFEPCAQALVFLVGPLDAGVEYYGAYGRVDRFGSENVNRLFGVFDLVWRRFAIQLGAGYDFTGRDRVLVKSILTFDLDD